MLSCPSCSHMAHHLFASLVPSLPATRESIADAEMARGFGKGPVGAAPGGGGKGCIIFFPIMSGFGFSGSCDEMENAFLEWTGCLGVSLLSILLLAPASVLPLIAWPFATFPSMFGQ